MMEHDEQVETRPRKIPIVLVTVKFLTRKEGGRTQPVFHDRPYEQSLYMPQTMMANNLFTFNRNAAGQAENIELFKPLPKFVPSDQPLKSVGFRITNRDALEYKAIQTDMYLIWYEEQSYDEYVDNAQFIISEGNWIVGYGVIDLGVNNEWIIN